MGGLILGRPLVDIERESMDTVETIKIVSKDSPDGYIVINKSDLTDKDSIYGERVSDDSQKKKKGK